MRQHGYKTRPGGQPGLRPVSQVGWVDHGSTRALNFKKNRETTSFHFFNGFLVKTQNDFVLVKQPGFSTNLAQAKP